jgi:hypothetical protein
MDQLQRGVQMRQSQCHVARQSFELGTLKGTKTLQSTIGTAFEEFHKQYRGMQVSAMRSPKKKWKALRKVRAPVCTSGQCFVCVYFPTGVLASRIVKHFGSHFATSGDVDSFIHIPV